MRIWEYGGELPAQAVTQVFAFIARRGAGKTYAATCFAEQLLDEGYQIIAIDVVGVWWGLRYAADGQTIAHNIPVIGGLHGDLPLEETQGAAVADAVVNLGISAVLDVSMLTKSAQRRFLTDFAERFLQNKKSNRSPVHCFFEEAQEYMPQRYAHGGERMLGAFESFVKLGRNFGIGSSIISQRPQSVNKDPLSQVEVLICLQLNAAQERKAIADWVRDHDDGGTARTLLNELPKLNIGEAIVWSPAWLKIHVRTKILRKTTLDASATPTEENGAMLRLPEADFDLGTLRQALGDAESAKSKKPSAKPVRAISTREAGPNYDLQAAKRLLTRGLADFKKALELLDAKPARISEERFSRKAEICAPDLEPKPARVIASRPLKLVASAPARRPQRRLTREPAITRVEITLVAWYPRAIDKKPLATLSTLSWKSSTFRNALTDLRARELFTIESGTQKLLATKKLLALHPLVARVPIKPEQTIERWRETLGGAALRVFDVVVSRGPTGAFERLDLATRAELSADASTYRNALTVLRSNGLVETSRGSTNVKPAAALFETR